MKFWKFALPAVAACLACCAPLLAPLFAGSVFTGLGLAGYFESIELALLVVAAGLIGYWFFRRRQRLAKSCICAPDSGCHTGNACDTP